MLSVPQVKKLVLIAGPSCVGKTTLVKRVREEPESELSERLGIDKSESWMSVDAEHLPKLSEPYVEKMILHYGITKLYYGKPG